MSILNVVNAKISYGNTLAVDDVSFSVKEGEYICIAGANGSGKSTLLKGIMGMLPLESGKIELSLPFNKISYLSQISGAENNFPATVWEIVLSGTQKKNGKLPFYTKKDKEDALDAICQMGIEYIKDKPIGDLSGGQQQRAFLARALCRKPKLMLLDEPCCGLDVSITEELYKIYYELNKNGVTVIMASHDFDAISRYAKRVLRMNNSHLDFDGSVADWRNATWKN